MSNYSIHNNTVIYLSFGDRLRVLFGKAIRLNTDFATIPEEVQVTDTRQVVWVDQFFPKKPVQLTLEANGTAKG